METNIHRVKLIADAEHYVRGQLAQIHKEAFRRSSGLQLGGSLMMIGQVQDDLAKAVLRGMEIVEYDRGRGFVIAWRPNGVVNLGLQSAQDRWFGINGPPGAISHIGLSSSTATVTAATTTLGGTVSIKAISPAASRTNQTVTAGATWTQADSPGPKTFVVTKVGLLNTSTDAGTGLMNVIGGTGGSSPYNEPFTVDFTSITTFSLKFQIDMLATAT
jgi:hypothetical protein